MSGKEPCEAKRRRSELESELELESEVRQEAQVIQSVRIRHGQGVAAPPRSEPCSRGGDEAAEAKGINEVGCNMCERSTTPKSSVLQRPTFLAEGRQHRCPSVSARWQRLCRGSWRRHASRWSVCELGRSVRFRLISVEEGGML